LGFENLRFGAVKFSHGKFWECFIRAPFFFKSSMHFSLMVEPTPLEKYAKVKIGDHFPQGSG